MYWLEVGIRMIFFKTKDQIGAEMLDSNNTITDNGAEVKTQDGAEVLSGILVAKLQLYDLWRFSIHMLSDCTVLISISKMIILYFELVYLRQVNWW